MALSTQSTAGTADALIVSCCSALGSALITEHLALQRLLMLQCRTVCRFEACRACCFVWVKPAALQAEKQAERQACQTLLVLGELGRVADLSQYPDAAQRILEAVSNPSDDTKATAALALGGIAVGNPAEYLPVLLDRVRSVRDSEEDSANATKKASQLYLMLKALNELLKSLLAKEAALGESADPALQFSQSACILHAWCVF